MGEFGAEEFKSEEERIAAENFNDKQTQPEQTEQDIAKGPDLIQDNREPNQKLERNREMARVGTLKSLEIRLEGIINSISSESSPAAEIANTLREETISIRTPELLEGFEENQRNALELAGHQINEAFRVLNALDLPREGMAKLTETNKAQDLLKSASTIIQLVWQLQPRKTHEEFSG